MNQRTRLLDKSGRLPGVVFSDYVVAGTDFVEPGARVAPRPNGGLTSQTAVGADVRLDTPLGPGRLYVQIGHDAYRP